MGLRLLTQAAPHLGVQVRDPQSKTPSLVFEYVNNTDFKVGCG